MKLLSFTALSLLLSLTSFTIAQQTITSTVVESPDARPTDQDASPSPTEATSSASVVQATQIQSQDPSAVASVAPTYSNHVDVEGGASGDDGSSFNLSKGGLIAIVVVVVCVALFGSKF